MVWHVGREDRWGSHHGRHSLLESHYRQHSSSWVATPPRQLEPGYEGLAAFPTACVERKEDTAQGATQCQENCSPERKTSTGSAVETRLPKWRRSLPKMLEKRLDSSWEQEEERRTLRHRRADPTRLGVEVMWL
ncbi:hypothetical protein NDU88_004374 [Pleurodeles waltl]|uniref:Uncharacterized protein n=1 Tax=Pleurodeles waltl TaxID=8319 RepID=A0AAV7VIJ9_PLEWA|nr:hypothetical protein NDU88_004374 [Pleurodeles waltl]